MRLLNAILLNYIPKIVSVSLWIGYFRYNVDVWVVLGVTVYALSLSIYDFYQNKKTFDGVIELEETEHGAKKFSLIVNKDPETLQDQDRVVFLFKKAS